MTALKLSLAKFREYALREPEVLRAAGRVIVPKMLVAREMSADDAERSVRFVLSTTTADRMSDTIAQDGWKLDNYLANPVVLWAHDSYLPPVGKARDLSISADALLATAVFLPGDMHHPMGPGFGETLYRMYREGFLNAVSVGFSAEEWDVDRDRGGLDFKRQELLEFSAVPVPANPEALAVARSAGIDVSPIRLWCEQRLDTHDMILPEDQVRAAYKTLAPEQVSVPGWRGWLAKAASLFEASETKEPMAPMPEAEDEEEVDGMEALKQELAILAAKLDMVLERLPEKGCVAEEERAAEIEESKAEEAPAEVAPEVVEEKSADPQEMQNAVKAMVAEAVADAIRRATGALE